MHVWIIIYIYIYTHCIQHVQFLWLDITDQRAHVPMHVATRFQQFCNDPETESPTMYMEKAKLQGQLCSW